MSRSKTSSENTEPPHPPDDLQKRLTPEQYRIFKQNGTERPFENAYWNFQKPGLYVDILSGEALFSSKDKFDSGCGWPSFDKALNPEILETKTDLSFGMKRIEVRTKNTQGHLGHVFEDGPTETGLRYCINSAVLKFIPLEKLKDSGYEKYLSLFDDLDWKNIQSE